MKVKKLKVCILDENDNILKSSKVIMKFSDELEEDMMKFHGLDVEEEAIDMLFTNIMNTTNNFATKDDWKELK